MKYSRPRNVAPPVRPKKRSDYASYYESPASVVSPVPMESTELGMSAEGYKGEFEVEYELLARRVITATMLHPKKERFMKVLEGTGEVVLTQDGESTSVPFSRGTDIVLPANTQYFVSATSPVYLMFVQPKAYKAKLQYLGEAKAAVDKELPAVVSTAEVLASRRRGSKAVEQQRMLAQERNERLGIRETPEALGKAPAGPAIGGGPMPTYGSDLPGEPG